METKKQVNQRRAEEIARWLKSRRGREILRDKTLGRDFSRKFNALGRGFVPRPLNSDCAEIWDEQEASDIRPESTAG